MNETAERGSNLRAFSFLPSVALALLIAAPWVRSGYLFSTDWVGPRRFDLPTQISSSAPLQVALALVSRALGAEATGKLFVLAILVVGGLMAYRAVPSAGWVGRTAASVVFVANPFVFGRLHYGQLYLLAGYAVLPWAASRLRLLCAQPGWREAALFGLSISLVGVFTSHLFLVASVLALIVVSAHLATGDHKAAYARSLLGALVIAVTTAAAISAYWLVPFLLGRGVEAAVIGSTGAGQLHAYAAIPDRTLGLVPNLLGLYGFWAEGTGRFTSMKEFVLAWPAVLVALLVISGLGVVSAFRRRDQDRRIAPWVAGLVVAAVVGLILEMGMSHPLTSGFVQRLDATIPLYRGMRDAGKWAALLALAYSQLFGSGVGAILGWLRTLRLPSGRVEWVSSAAVGLLIALPLYYGNGLLFGMHGEIRPSAYPPGWYAADRVLAADGHAGRAVFLPWHEYMTLSFVKNQNSVVAPPAPSFFSTPILVSSNAELPGEISKDPDQVAIAELVKDGDQGHWAEVLATRQVKYVLVAREVDWRSYAYLNRQPNLTLVGDYGSIVLYRNTLVT